MDINQAIKEAANVFITEQSGETKVALNDSVVEALKLYVTDKGGTPASSSINDLVNQATAYYFTEKSVSPAPRGNDAIFDAAGRYLTAKSEYVPASFNERLLASSTYFINNGSGAPGIAAPFTSVNGTAAGFIVGAPLGWAEGWSVESASAIADDYEFDVDRAGYTTAAAPTTYRDRYLVTRKIRQSSPNQASLSATTYALSDYILSTDTPVGGVTNNSTLVMPKPVCNWIMLGRDVLGNTISTAANPIELTAWHYAARSGKQVAAVKFIVSDGTNEVSVVVTETGVSTRTSDKMSVTRYLMPETDISSLTALTSGRNRITLNAEVYPWIGGSASVAKSATDGNDKRGFSPRYFLRDTDRFTSPYIAYLDPTGDDVNGAISQTDGTAQAAPCATIAGAIKRATAVIGASTNGIDGLLIKANNGTYVNVSTGAAQTQRIAKVTVTRSSASTNRASVIFESSASTTTLQLGQGLIDTDVAEGCICFKDVTAKRTGINPFISGNTTHLCIQWDDCDFDTNTQTSTARGTLCHWYANGLTFVGTYTGGLSATTGGQLRMARGITMGTATTLELWLIVGCDLILTGISPFSSSINPTSGSIFIFNKVRRLTGTGTSNFAYSATGADGIVNSGNVFEWCTVTSGTNWTLINDGTAYNVTHVIEHCNTYIGWSTQGRLNVGYDDGATERYCKFWSSVGNIHTAVYTKGDVFRYVNEANPEGYTIGSPSTRVGNWGFKYNVGRRNNFAQFQSSDPAQQASNQGLEFVPPGGAVGVNYNNTSDTTRVAARNTIFVDFKGTTSIFEGTGAGSATTALAGAGSGDYKLPIGSPARNMVTDAVLSHTSDGVARSLTSDHAGALSAV